MIKRINSNLGMHAENRRAPKSVIRLTILSLLVIISLSCGINSNPAGPVNPVEPVKPVEPGKPVGVGFTKADCQGTGVFSPDIAIDYIVDEINDGPSIVCNSSSQGDHGSIQVYISIAAYQADKLDGFYQNQKTTIKVFVDQSTEWNSHPDMPEEEKDVITFL